MQIPLMLPRAGPCAGSGAIRRQPADFQVDELIDIQPEGLGEHLWLRVRKCGENTDHVARLLARSANVAASAVGYAGRKDRHAVTTQWFSVQLPGRPDPETWDLPRSIEILESVRHLRKLHTGSLRGNRFRIVVRDFCGDGAVLEQRLQSLGKSGTPNYFGTQRFGHDSNNVEQALQWFRGHTMVRDRKLRGLLLSAARSCLFNAILARRVGDGSWCAALSGDLMILDGRGSFFALDVVDDTTRARVVEGEIHPTGALWGRGQPDTRGAVAELERAVADAHAEIVAGLVTHGLRQERRALRVMPRGLSWQWQDAETLELQFALSAGCYATTLLEDLLELSA